MGEKYRQERLERKNAELREDIRSLRAKPRGAVAKDENGEDEEEEEGEEGQGTSSKVKIQSSPKKDPNRHRSFFGADRKGVLPPGAPVRQAMGQPRAPLHPENPMAHTMQ